MRELLSDKREQGEDTLDLELEDEKRRHFTGPFVTHPIAGRQLSRYEVIDGQQRLTTFQIILCVIRDICLSQGSDGLTQLANEVTELIVNSDTVIKETLQSVSLIPLISSALRTMIDLHLKR